MVPSKTAINSVITKSSVNSGVVVAIPGGRSGVWIDIAALAVDKSQVIFQGFCRLSMILVIHIHQDICVAHQQILYYQA